MRHGSARASALWATSFAIAPALAAPLIIGLTLAFGWRAMFLCLVPLAIVTAAVNALVIPRSTNVDAPSKRTSVTRGDLATMLRQPSLWILLIGYFAYNIGYWGYVGWMPTYLVSVHDIDIKKLGLLGSIPYLFGVLGLLLTGWLGSGPLYRFRPQLLATSYVLAAVALAVAFRADTLPMTMAGLSAAAFCLFGGLSLFGAIVLEFAPPERSGTYAGAVTTAGQIGGIVAPVLIGHLVSRSGEFSGGFTLMIAAFVVAAMCMLALVPHGDRLLRTAPTPA